MKLESISSVADSVKPKSLFLICDFQNSQVPAVLQFHWCGQHPPPSEHSTTTRLKMSPYHVSVVRGWFCCLVAAFGSGSPPGARMPLSEALSPSLGLRAVVAGGARRWAGSGSVPHRAHHGSESSRCSGVSSTGYMDRQAPASGQVTPRWQPLDVREARCFRACARHQLRADVLCWPGLWHLLRRIP